MHGATRDEWLAGQSEHGSAKCAREGHGIGTHDEGVCEKKKKGREKQKEGEMGEIGGRS